MHSIADLSLGALDFGEIGNNIGGLESGSGSILRTESQSPSSFFDNILNSSGHRAASAPLSRTYLLLYHASLVLMLLLASQSIVSQYPFWSNPFSRQANFHSKGGHYYLDETSGIFKWYFLRFWPWAKTYFNPNSSFQISLIWSSTTNLKRVQMFTKNLSRTLFVSFPYQKKSPFKHILEMDRPLAKHFNFTYLTNFLTWN